MDIAIYPGSFDPVTLGHLDIINRSSQLCDRLIVAILKNNEKKALFTIKERKEMLLEATKDIPNVEIRSFGGLLVEFADECKANVIVRGLRAITDFEYEIQMAQTNHILNPRIDTVFLTTDLRYSYLSSSIVKEVAVNRGDIKAFVPPNVIECMHQKLKNKNKDNTKCLN